MVRATQRRRDIASPQCAYEFRQPALLNRFNNSTKVIWPRSVTRPAYSNLPYDFNYFANPDSETSRNYDFAISEEFHVPNVPVHHKYSEAIALGIGGIYKKAFVRRIVCLGCAHNFFPVEEGHLHFPTRLPISDFLCLLVPAVASEVF